MIDITRVDLVAFAKKVYELSVPRGMGFLHFTPEPLTDEEAEQCVNINGQEAINMDYVNGRACKMFVRRENGKLTIPDTWYDHTDQAYQELLRAFGIRKPDTHEHGCACDCTDCQMR